MKGLYCLIFILGISFLAYGAEEKKEETPLEFNFRWYQNDFKWWDIWQGELYANLGKEEAKDSYNAEKVIDSIDKLRKWVIPEKAILFEEFREFYKMVKEKVEKGNLKRHDVRKIQSLLKEKRKEFITRFHYNNIKPEEWINKEIVDKSAFEKVEITPIVSISPKESGYRYVAHRYGKTFHKLNCEDAEDIRESDRIYFKTKRRAFSTGRKPCRNCKP